MKQGAEEVFNWKAVDQNGRPVRGVSPADRVSQVCAHVRKLGYVPIQISQRGGIRVRLGLTERSAMHWESFAKRLYILLETGIPLLKALDILGQSAKKPGQRQAWRQVRDSIEDGEALSEAVCLSGCRPQAIMQTMLKAGEKMGNLARALEYMGKELERQRLFRRKMMMAMSYPALLFLAVIFVLFALSVWVTPVYENLFQGMGIESPPLSRMIFAGARILPRGFGVILAASGIALMALRIRYPLTWREQSLKWLSALPYIRTVWVLKDWVQWHRIVEISLRSGLNLLEALRLTTGAIQTTTARNLNAQLILAVQQGQRLTSILRAERVFPAEACEMLSVAEESGQLGEMFQRVAEQLQAEFEGKLHRMTKVIEPLLILGVTALIGFVAMGVLLPVLDASTQIY
ncbi:MAG: type II secretion system F family protein [Peptococcaceae bacterium]|jgi:type IV pilus assembly protein PilC|nr:type II secretion system F family protein [Peptococcaceae bacterium]